MNLLRTDQRGNTTIVVMVAILIILLGFISWKVFVHNDEAKKIAATEDTAQPSIQENKDNTAPAGGSILAVNSRNTIRRTDIAKLLSATAEYSLNNNGNLPSDYENGFLTGAEYPAKPDMKHYQTVKIEYSEHIALTSDAVVLVLGADCDTTKAAITSGSSRAYVAIYGLEQTDGSFKPACEAA